MNQMVSCKTNEMTKMNLYFVKEKEVMQTKFDANRRRLHAELLLSVHDLECIKFRLVHRESRPEDVFEIRSL